MDGVKTPPNVPSLFELFVVIIITGYFQPLLLLYSLITPIAMISRILPPLILNNSDMGMLLGCPT
jgi:hypothetical protein